ncbi:MAG: flagellar brake protein [bacterium]
MYLLQQIRLYFLQLTAQAEPQTSPYGRIGQAFTEGRWQMMGPLVYGLLVLFGLIFGTYGLYWVWNQLTGEKKKKITVLEALQENYELSSSQNRYLDALVEKFKNRNPHDPEISNDYLLNFLKYTVQNLTHAPDQRLRRQVHHVPELKAGDIMQVMINIDQEFRTHTCKIIEQNKKYIHLTFSEDRPPLEKGKQVEVSYRQEDLYFRGKGKIENVLEDKIIIHLPDGLHFEEKRTFFRLPVDSLPCKLTLKDSGDNTAVLKGEMEDISAEGACVLIDETDKIDLEQHLRGTIEFELPGFREVNIRVEIARTQDKGNQLELGMKFTRIGMAVRERIIQFIHNRQPESS